MKIWERKGYGGAKRCQSQEPPSKTMSASASPTHIQFSDRLWSSLPRSTPVSAWLPPVTGSSAPIEA